MVENNQLESIKKCYLCSKDINKSWYEKTKSVFVSTYIKCIVCNNIICSDCYVDSEKFFLEKKQIGYCCKQQNCLDKVRANLKVPFVDLNPVYNILEKQIPDLAKDLNENLKDLVKVTSHEHLPKFLDDLNTTVSTKLEEIKNVFEEQKAKTKNDAKELIDFTTNEKLPKLLEETNKVISSKFDELKKTFEEQKVSTKTDINDLIDITIKEKLPQLFQKTKKYIISEFKKKFKPKPSFIFLAFFIPIVFFIIVSGLVTLEVLLIIKYLN